MWNAGASPCTDDILGKERLFGIITETCIDVVQYLTGCPSHDDVPLNTVRRFFSLLLSVHAPFCLVHVVIACI